jgi:hypothetical protein
MKTLLTLSAFTLLAAQGMRAQQLLANNANAPAEVSTSAVADGEEQIQISPAVSAKPAPPIGTIAAGYAYLFADQGDGTHSNLNGWLAKPTYNLPQGWAVYLDASNYYGRNAKGSINLHTYSLGVSKEVFAKPKFKPALFLQMGDSRNSNAGKIVNAYAMLTGINLTVPLRSWVSLSVIPAEYVFTYPDGDPRNSFNAKASLVFPIGHRKS